ncbi:alanine racemase [Arthrobacter tecti]
MLDGKIPKMPNLSGHLPLQSLPQLLLDVAAIDSNIALKERWAAEHSMVLAPHIKTTMTREIVQMQLPGAWGVTVATVGQAVHAAAWGARRILIANEVVFTPQVLQLRRLLEADHTLDIFCLVDSAAGVIALGEVFDGAGPRLNVLIDVGVGRGRTGIRTADEAPQLADEIDRQAGLRLAGVSAYEGIAPNLRTAENLEHVDTHCRLARTIFEGLRERLGEQPIFTIGGSAFQDRAAQFLPSGAVNVLRSGCYVVHDHGTYADVSPLPGLQAAAVVRAVVVSVPEEARAVLGAGKRELAYDAGLPTLVAHHRNGEAQAEPAGVVVKLFDHHAIVESADGLEVGDTVDLGISHPCSVFDRWRSVLAVHGNATELWHPQF